MYIRLKEYIEERYINLDLIESFEFTQDLDNFRTCCIIMSSGEKVYVDEEWFREIVKKYLKGKIV